MAEVKGANLQWQDDSGEWLDIGPIDISPPKTSEVWRKRIEPFSITIVTICDYDVWGLAARQAAMSEVDTGQ